jgi:hypothetical protein
MMKAKLWNMAVLLATGFDGFRFLFFQFCYQKGLVGKILPPTIEDFSNALLLH